MRYQLQGWRAATCGSQQCADLSAEKFFLKLTFITYLEGQVCHSRQCESEHAKPNMCHKMLHMHFGSQCKQVLQLVSSFCVLLVCKYACRVDTDMQSCIAKNDDVIWKLTNKWGNIFCFVCVRVCFCAVFFILSNYALISVRSCHS